MEKIQYVKDNDKFVKLHAEFDEYSVIKNDAYFVNDEIYLYRGRYTKTSKNERLNGLYLKDNGSFVKVGEPNFSKDAIVGSNSEQNNSLKNLLTNIKSMDIGKKEEKPVVEKEKKVKEKRKLNNNRRIKRDEPLSFTVYNDDDPMVTIIKEKINSSSLTMADIYNSVNSDNLGYNLFYGLSTRSNMSWKTFEIWCEILKVEPNLSICDIK